MPHLFAVLAPLFFLSFSCIGAGAAIFRFFPDRKQSFGAPHLATCMLLGQGAFGGILLFPAMAQVFTRPVVLTLTTPFALFGLWQLRPLLNTDIANWRIHLISMWRVPLRWKLATLVTLALLGAFGAAVSGIIEGDALAFYLTLPKIIGASHRLMQLPGYETFMSVGLTAEIQLAALYLLGMPGASPKLYLWLTMLAGAAVLVAMARNVGLGRRAQLLCLAMLSTSSAAIILLEGKTDFFAAAYGLCALLFALQSWDDPKRASTVKLTGLFTGIALIAKLSYAVAFFPGVLIVLFYRPLVELKSAWNNKPVRRRLLQQLVLHLFWFGLFTALAFIPHFIKNMVVLGSFSGASVSFNYFSPETTKRIVLLYPLVLTFGRYWGQLGNISPLLLAFLPLLILLPRGPAPIREKIVVLSLAAVAGLILWVIALPAVPIPRYYFATLLMLTIPAAWAAERLGRECWLADNLVAASVVVCVAIAYNVWSPTIFPVPTAYKYLFTKQSDEERGKSLNINEVLFREGFESINRVAAPGARVFLASYFRFWLRPDLIQTSNNDLENSTEKWHEGNPEKLWRMLYEHGFEYIYMDSTQRWTALIKTPPPWVSIEELYPKGAFYGTSYGSAFKITFHNAPSTQFWGTREVAPGAWELVKLEPKS
ncbi:hypothetical protein [Herbaspirillum sp. alder98]|uniref:hypothetical protein n=1 Tax=Herbaspirillum sp. alder98 TaxID=2913096 RepID=UPI001CD835D4|nr:hypothetical protein [Herbaspirillum sp. alder98]MCA1324311.1 hypothetical protein [Herbaspirillum sp. alder98]